MIDQKREHIASRDCWCNPYVLGVNETLVLRESGTVVANTMLPDGRIALHLETDKGQE